MSRRSRRNFCGSPDHALSRRGFMAGTAAGAAAFSADMTQVDILGTQALAADLKSQQKSVIMLWLAGGASQLETWDPKPGRETGGPYGAIDTAVPGVRISELMPKMSQRLKHTAIIRSLNTRDGGHGGGAQMMMRGRKDEPNVAYPDLGAMLARELGRADSPVPDYVNFYTSTEGRNSARIGSGFLGSRFAPIKLTTENIPPNLKRLDSITDVDHLQRAELQKRLNAQFAAGRSTNSVNSHGTAYARVHGLMSSEKLFDISQEPQNIRDKYGPTQFAEQVLVARRLAEAGVPFIRVSRAWWDSHGQNFETHLELCSELDHVMATLLDDLEQRSMLDNVMVVTLAEFGRTPRINASLGRDHFATAWSATLSGCGVKGGAVYGETDEDGNRVKDGEIGAGEFFATLFNALGIHHEKEYYIGSRPIPLVNPGIHPVKEVLA